MKKKSLFKRVSGVLTGVFFSTSFILAANENGQLFGSETLDCGGCSTAFICPPASLCEKITFQYE